MVSKKVMNSKKVAVITLYIIYNIGGILKTGSH